MFKLLIFTATFTLIVAQGPIGPGIPDSRCPPWDDPQRPVHLPHSHDCGLFLKCSNGLAFPFACPTNQHWAVRLDRCDWPQ